MLRRHRFWRPITPLTDEIRKNLHIKHTKPAQWERILNPVNPLDYSPAAAVFVKHLYQYVKDNDIDSGDKLALALIHIKNALNVDLNIEITDSQVRSKWEDISREFFNFREFLEFSGVRLVDNKKNAIASLAYFRDVKPEAGPQGYYHIFDRNSDVDEEIMDIWDYDPEML